MNSNLLVYLTVLSKRKREIAKRKAGLLKLLLEDVINQSACTVFVSINGFLEVANSKVFLWGHCRENGEEI